MIELLSQATGVEAYRWHQRKHPGAGFFSHILAGVEQFMSPAEDRICRFVEEEQDRIDLIPNLVEKSRSRGELTSKIIGPQYWRKAKLIDVASHVPVACAISITVLSIQPSFPEIVALATLTKVLANSAVIKLQTRS